MAVLSPANKSLQECGRRFNGSTGAANGTRWANIGSGGFDHGRGDGFRVKCGLSIPVKSADDNSMRNRLKEFAEHLRKAHENQRSERIVRAIIQEIAIDCPMHVLVHIGQSIIDCRKSELRDDAEQN
jgi:hypothetical protein